MIIMQFEPGKVVLIMRAVVIGSKAKVNFLLDAETIAFLQDIKARTGINQSRALSMFVNRYGAEFSQELEKYAKKGETVSTVSTFIE